MDGTGSGRRDSERRGTTVELVDIETVARRLGVTVRHVRRLVSEARIPLIKWGHLLRFDPVEIEAWIDSQRRPPGAGRSPDQNLKP